MTSNNDGGQTGSRRGGFMPDNKTVKELMIDVFEYPHMPYWFTIRQAVGIMKKAVIDVQKCINPQVILVFDEKYNLIGSLAINDILRGLVPGIAAPIPSASAASNQADDLAKVEASLSGTEKSSLEKPISEIMKPVKMSVTLEDSVAKAAFLMERGNLQVLPVLENNKKLVGVVRTIEVFREISSIITGK